MTINELKRLNENNPDVLYIVENGKPRAVSKDAFASREHFETTKREYLKFCEKEVKNNRKFEMRSRRDSKKYIVSAPELTSHDNTEKTVEAKEALDSLLKYVKNNFKPIYYNTFYDYHIMHKSLASIAKCEDVTERAIYNRLEYVKEKICKIKDQFMP